MAEELPKAPEAEQYLIGAALVAPETISAMATISPADFSDEAHRLAFAAVRRRHQRQEPVDVVAVKHALAGLPSFPAEPAVYLAEVGQQFTSTAHLSHYVDELLEASRKRALLELAETARDASLNGKGSDEILADLGSGVEDLMRGRSNKPRYGVLDARTLAGGDYRVRYLVPGILAERQPQLIGGPKKALKTSILCDLLLSLAIGDEFLGKFRVAGSRRVLFMSGESGTGTIQETCRRIATAKGWQLEEVPNFHFTADLPKLGSTLDLQALEALIGAHAVDVLCIDPAYLTMPAVDAGNLFAQGELLRNLSALCESAEATVLLAHHFRKNREPKGVPDLDDLSWAGFAEFARQWLLLDRRDPYVPGTGEHRLVMTAGGSAGHSGAWALDINEGAADAAAGRMWDVTVRSFSELDADDADRKEQQREERRLEQLTDDKQKVCRVLAKHSEGLTKTALRDRVSISGGRFATVLATMLNDGEIVPTQVTVSNQKTPREGFKLNGNDATQAA